MFKRTRSRTTLISTRDRLISKAARAARISFAFAAAIAMVSSAEARGPTPQHDQWSDAHIQGLPREIRTQISRFATACGGLQARHEFSRSLSPRGMNVQFVSLHFEHLACANSKAVCTEQGCLHEVYVSTGSGYRRVLSVQAGDLTLKEIDGRVFAQLECVNQSAQCARVLRWTGKGFASGR